MQHCLNKRRNHETFTNDPEEFQEEFQTWNGSPQKERKSSTDKRRRAAVRHIERWKARIAKHQQYRN